MINKKIGFIGSGNMAYSLIGGLTNTGVNSENIWVSDPDSEKTQRLEQQFAIQISLNNIDLLNQVDIIILAVKPQQLHSVCSEIAAPLAARMSQAHRDSAPLVISIAAGVTIEALQQWLVQDASPLALVRCMPNTPALVQTGATALFANDHVSDEQKTAAESIMRAVGITLWLEQEQQMNAVTALSGSGPAYFFLMLEILERVGEKLGLEKQTSHLLAIQTAMGASKMALESDDSPHTLRERVTSPGGTTEKAIDILQQGELEKLFEKALSGARDRSVELAQIFGNE